MQDEHTKDRRKTSERTKSQSIQLVFLFFLFVISCREFVGVVSQVQHLFQFANASNSNANKWRRRNERTNEGKKSQNAMWTQWIFREIKEEFAVLIMSRNFSFSLSLDIDDGILFSVDADSLFYMRKMSSLRQNNDKKKKTWQNRAQTRRRKWKSLHRVSFACRFMMHEHFRTTCNFHGAWVSLWANVHILPISWIERKSENFVFELISSFFFSFKSSVWHERPEQEEEKNRRKNFFVSLVYTNEASADERHHFRPIQIIKFQRRTSLCDWRARKRKVNAKVYRSQVEETFAQNEVEESSNKRKLLFLFRHEVRTAPKDAIDRQHDLSERNDKKITFRPNKNKLKWEMNRRFALAKRQLTIWFSPHLDRFIRNFFFFLQTENQIWISNEFLANQSPHVFFGNCRKPQTTGKCQKARKFILIFNKCKIMQMHDIALFSQHRRGAKCKENWLSN